MLAYLFRALNLLLDLRASRSSYPRDLAPPTQKTAHSTSRIADCENPSINPGSSARLSRNASSQTRRLTRRTKNRMSDSEKPSENHGFRICI